MSEKHHEDPTETASKSSKKELDEEERGAERNDKPSLSPRASLEDINGVFVRNTHRTREKEPSRWTEVVYGRTRQMDRLARELEMRERFIAAFCGGLSLIGPMFIMAIKPSQIKTLVTSSVAVLIFSLGLAWRSSAKIETLLATTAAYAAVMVVFVGVNGK